MHISAFNINIYNYVKKITYILKPKITPSFLIGSFHFLFSLIHLNLSFNQIEVIENANDYKINFKGQISKLIFPNGRLNIS